MLVWRGPLGTSFSELNDLVVWSGVFDVKLAGGKRGASCSCMDLLEEMIKLSKLSTPISGVLREWKNEKIMEPLGKHLLFDVNEKWAEYMYGKGNSPAL